MLLLCYSQIVAWNSYKLLCHFVYYFIQKLIIVGCYKEGGEEGGLQRNVALNL